MKKTNKNELVEKASRTFYKAGFKLKKHSPEILMVGGVVGLVASGIIACKATTKLSTILEDSKEQIETFDKVAANPEMVNEEYTAEDAEKDKRIVKVQTAVKVVKLYAPSVAVGVVSIGAIFASNNIMRKRNLALGAAYATVDRAFKDYRDRVIDRFGEDLDKELRYNLKTKEVKETVEDKNGKKKTVKKTITYMDTPLASEFAVIYDDGCAGWTKDPEANKIFLIQQQRYANERLKKRGVLSLNEVYEMLGFRPTRAGQVVGWLYDCKDPDYKGDDYVDFNIFNLEKESNRDFVNGYERNVLLDFNVAPIYNFMKDGGTSL